MATAATLYEARNRGDLAAVSALLDGSVTYHDRAQPLTMRGRAEVIAFLRRSHEAIPDLTFEVITSLDSTDHFAAEIVMRGTQNIDLPGIGRAGSRIELAYAVVGDRQHGRITRLVEYYNAAELTAGAQDKPVAVH